MSRKCCKECPWVTPSNHNRSWSNYVAKMMGLKKSKEPRHACHMITSDVWGMKTIIDESNVCIGAKNSQKTKSNSSPPSADI